MRFFILLILSMTVVTTTACSKKKSSAVTPPAVTDTDDDSDDDDDDDGNSPSGVVVKKIPYMNAPVNGEYYLGSLTNKNATVYREFIKAALGYTTNGSGYMGDGYTYNFNYSCSFNIFALFFDQEGLSCGTSSNHIEKYLVAMTNAPAMVALWIYADGSIEGEFMVDAYKVCNFYNECYIDFYMSIPFAGEITKLNNGKYMIEAGPLAFVTKVVPTNASKAANFNTYFYNNNDGSDLKFGEIILK